MKIRLKKFLNKYKNRIFSFIAVIACIPLLNLNAYALNATYPQYTLDVHKLYSTTLGGHFNLGDNYVYSYTGEHTLTDGLVIRMWSDDSETDNTLSFPVMPDLYDYYIYTSFGQRSTGGTFAPNSIVLCNGRGSSLYPTYLSDIYFYKTQFLAADSLYNMIKYNFVAKLNVTESRNNYYFGGIKFEGTGTIKSVSYFEFTIFLVPKGETFAVDNIVSAINNQTDVLSGYIDKGNGSTGGIVSGNNSAIDNLDEVVSEYHAAEQQFFDDFTANQQAITSDIVGWSWGGLVNCANWVGETMTDYYNNMGDFRQYIIYPLMLGIALFFLGRGGSIIGHLFRKPTETTVNTKSVFKREGNTKYTTTTTSRQGGVWRR